jgi:hypothetical protein
MSLVKKLFASLGSVVLIASAVGITSAPASATRQTPTGVTITKSEPNVVATIDCVVALNSSIEIPGTERGTLTVHMKNCVGKKLVVGTPGIVVSGTTHANETLNPIPANFTVSNGASLDFQSAAGASEFTLDYIAARSIRQNPSGPLAGSTNMVIGLRPKSFTVTENNPNGGTPVHDLGTDSSCRVEIGEHAYTTKKIKITTFGSFTFRFVKTNNENRDQVFWGTDSPINDPFLAVYQDFDPNHMDTNVIGCNDDSGSTDESVSGQLLQSKYSEFTARLQPGNYTLVLATFGVAPASTWTKAAGGTFELWGEGLDIGAAPAATGTKVAGFGVNGWRLNNRVINGINKLLTKPKTITAVTCTGTTQNSVVSASGKALAKARATMACLHIKAKYPTIKTTVVANPATGQSAGDRAVLIEITR